MGGRSKKMDLVRTNSICPPPETVLLESVKKNDTESMKTVIKANPSILQHLYPYTSQTILSLACSEPGVAPDTVNQLIELGADIEGTPQWKPLHLSADNPNILILEVVIKHLKPGQINEKWNGNTALHTLIKGEKIKKDEENFCRHVELLLQSGIDVNQGDGKNLTAIFWAAKYGYKKIVKVILEESVLHVDLDTCSLRDKTARDLINEKGLYEGPLPERILYQVPKDKIFGLIKEGKEDEFISYFETLSLNNPSDFVNADDGASTLLQYSCERGLAKVVEYLLDKGANVNLVTKNQRKPIDIVADIGYFEIFELLFKCPDLELSIDTLCNLLKHSNSPKFGKINHEKCCKLLLDKLGNRRPPIDINEVDHLNNIPLHYSLRYCDTTTTQKLLQLGASLAYKNEFGSMPIQDIKPEVLENHLDNCVTFDLKNAEKRDFEVVFDYQTLLPPRKRKRFKYEEVDPEFLATNNVKPETEVIAYMSKAPEFRALLKHPLIVSFLFMKWHQIRLLFYTNLVFYICFVLSLVVYIFTHYANFDRTQSDYCLIFGKFSWFTLNLTFWVLVLREVFQVAVAPRKYFCNFENLVEIILIVVTGMILYIDSPTSHTRRQLASVAILLAAFELVLMVGQHPKLSTNVVMLKTVSVNFFKLLLWYSLLIIAFALSFYILFAKTEMAQSVNGTETGDEDDVFKGPGKSLFKTIVMLTGEFDAGSINFHTYPVTSKIIFSLFVFMITIILLNLLNGLAVSDTQTIKNDAELVGHISRAQHIYYVESMLLGNILPTSFIQAVQRLFCCCPCDSDTTYTFFKPLSRKVCLFTQNCQLTVLPNEYGKISCELNSSAKKRPDPLVTCTRNCSEAYLDKNTIRRIADIVKARREREEYPTVTNLKQLYGEIVSIKAKLDQILGSLSTNQNAL
ncbi:painless isoform X1 [Tribolium castaneum]|uniref:Painless n=1 Tax=Tribolium castaneum TaxID=7070 RepID=D2A388_TRICA|nr:painless [Tribolium castaneum]XP_008191735.1 PREDICTED: painless isoform X1 [Tribolium castaneum]XP_008191737.1 PREDICTED: painless isoform X1 [Tribolium castaneum]XP_015834308.1 PREDICTED: painless isoform X1 [Tribolium castaneum]EFA02836.1 painless [Tribolium castaneum]|eukprot:NP_001164308.1 painless [Tribolium castaneum]